jgi:hypothetical protein
VICILTKNKIIYPPLAVKVFIFPSPFSWETAKRSVGGEGVRE